MSGHSAKEALHRVRVAAARDRVLANLSEGALAEVTEGMALVSRAERHLNNLEARLQNCRISVDGDSFKHIRFYLDQLHAQLAPIPLAVAEAKEGQGA